MATPGAPSNLGTSQTPQHIPRRAPLASETVRDDWDDEEDEEEEEAPQQLWEEANKRAPMPELVLAGSSTSSSAAIAPAAAALQPVLRILKRPTATPSPPPSSSVSTLPPDATSSSLAEREARYQAARDRIFADVSPAATSPNQPSAKAAANNGPPSIQITREPKGPPTQEAPQFPNGKGQHARGFESRKGKRRGRGGP
ncbi:hypothetical protein C8Q80DRAFT_1274091 [Daedaleopsis nitida]|nr:hypothetical protein C8Q80DRAFT_1274091 [Daedaleopsis nitida]